MPQKPKDDLPDDPITSGPGVQSPQAAAPGAGEEDLPDDPIISTGKRPGATSDKPFRKELTPEQQAAQARTEKYLQAAAPPDLWGNVKELGGTLWGDVSGLAKTAWKLGTEDPDLIPGQLLDMAKGLGQAQLDEFKKAYEFYKEGDYGRAATYTGFGLIPLLGPAAADIAEDIGGGHYGRAGAHLLELVGPELFKFFKIGPVVKKLPVAPELEAALTETEQAGIKQTVGQRMRSERLQRGERNLQNFPGSEQQRAAQLQKQRSQLKARGESLAEQQSPMTPKLTQSETGKLVQDRMTQRVNRFKAAADNAYDEFRQQAALGKKSLWNGKYKIVRDAKGNIVSKTKIMEDFETPVDIRNIRAKLKPVWDDLQAPFQDPAKAAASPGYQKFAQLMREQSWYMDAVDFDRTMGAIKSITRNGNNPLLSNRSQGIAKLMIKEGEQALDTAFSSVKATSPTIKQALERGRRLVRTYYDQAEFTQGLGKQPSDVYRFITKAGKGSLEEIQRLRSYAPQELAQVARSFLEGAIEEGSEAGGPFERMGRMAQVFENLDGEVQNALFGKAQAAELKRYFDAARYLNPQIGSPTGANLAQFLHIAEASEAVGSVLTGLITGHPIAGIAYGLGGVAAYATQEHIWPRMQARLLLQPGTPRLLTQAIKLPGNSKMWTRAVQTLVVRARAAEQHERREAEEARRARGQAPAPGAQAGRGGRPAEVPRGGGRGAPRVPAGPPPGGSPLGPRVAEETPEGQEAAPSEAPTRAPGTAAAFTGPPAPGATTVGGWPVGARGAVMPTPPGGTQPGGAPGAPAAAETPTPPAGTTWEYWGLKPPAGTTEAPAARPAPRAPAAPPGRPAARPRISGAVTQFQPIFQQVGRGMGVPPGLLSVVAQLESSGNPNAIGGSGERGLMQLMPATARSLGVDPMDPQQAVRGAATLLQHLMRKYRGNIASVLAAYNEGETAFDRRMKRGLPLPPVTQRYVRNGLALLRQGGQVQMAGVG